MKLPKEVKDKRKRRCLFVWLQMDRFLEPRIRSLFASHRLICYEIKNRFNPPKNAGKRYVADEAVWKSKLLRQYGEPRIGFKYPDGYQPEVTKARADSEDAYDIVNGEVRPHEKLFEELRDDSRSVVERRGTYEYAIDNKDERGPPLNPEGRTGVIGLGELKRFGPNHAVDLCVTRRDPQTQNWQILVLKTIQRDERDHCLKAEYRLPGKRVRDFNKSTSETMKNVRRSPHPSPLCAGAAPPARFQYARQITIHLACLHATRITKHAATPSSSFHAPESPAVQRSPPPPPVHGSSSWRSSFAPWSFATNRISA